MICDEFISKVKSIPDDAENGSLKEEKMFLIDATKHLQAIVEKKLLGYIFDILVNLLQVKKNGGIEIKGYSRMADFSDIIYYKAKTTEVANTVS